ncbi:MAG: hypothetical protein Q4G08_05470 [Capnocytophaga sp.]|nr:hypothetical protein [Capnocytophaga sp.]
MAELYEEIEMLEDIKAYREAKSEPVEYELFNLVVEEINVSKNGE